MHVEARPIPRVWSSVIESFDSVTWLEVTPVGGESYLAMRRRVFAAFTDRNPWAAVLWEILVTGGQDSPYARALSFWRRHGETHGVNEGAIEASRIADGYIHRSAANPITDATAFLDTLERRGNAIRSVGFLMATEKGTRQVEQVLDVALTLPRGGTYEAHFRMVAAATAAGSGLLMQDETERHEPSLSFYGQADVIGTIQATLGST